MKGTSCFRAELAKFKLYSHVSVFSLFLSFPLAGAAEEPPERPQTSERWRFPAAEVGFTRRHAQRTTQKQVEPLVCGKSDKISAVLLVFTPTAHVCVLSRFSNHLTTDLDNNININVPPVETKVLM